MADWFFTTPAVIVQLLTGLWLTMKLGIAFSSAWFITVIGLFVFVGVCWLPVVWIQIRIQKLVAGGADKREYRQLMRVWIALGIPAFVAVLMLFYLMVFRLGTYAWPENGRPYY